VESDLRIRAGTIGLFFQGPCPSLGLDPGPAYVEVCPWTPPGSPLMLGAGFFLAVGAGLSVRFLFLFTRMMKLRQKFESRESRNGSGLGMHPSSPNQCIPY
jgi:hypothetical protein